MRYYRIYYLDDRGHIAAPAEIIQSLTDREAEEAALKFVDGKTLEVWEGDRLVTTVDLNNPPRT